ncbi:hypothetical protein CDAR_448121 [Caerostris darwini]|uniref:Uncharacterized protein n=1 Tax=Caerostris darwini TaxID=1538125 RepID=A0AAV4SEM6_9ARAC|nr:hypothetical protein CDAR_448121 [Caerostris darwini]
MAQWHHSKEYQTKSKNSMSRWNQCYVSSLQLMTNGALRALCNSGTNQKTVDNMCLQTSTSVGMDCLVTSAAYYSYGHGAAILCELFLVMRAVVTMINK